MTFRPRGSKSSWAKSEEFPDLIPCNVAVAQFVIRVQAQDIRRQQVGDNVLVLIERINGNQVLKPRSDCIRIRDLAQKPIELFLKMFHERAPSLEQEFLWDGRGFLY